MKEKTGLVVAWLVKIGFPLALLLILMVGLTALADEPPAETPVEALTGMPSSGLAAAVTVTKSVTPQELWPWDVQVATYEVVFHNGSAEAVQLDGITDTLPTGFAWGGMAIHDEVGEPVDDNPPVIVWGPTTVPTNGMLTMRYNVIVADTPATYQNSVVVRVGGELIGPASASLVVRSGTVYLPLVFNGYPEAPPPPPGAQLPFNEDFSSDFKNNPDWEIFLNWPDLNPERWYWAGETDSWGIVNYEYNFSGLPEYNGYSMMIYNAEGAQDWTNYRIEASFKDAKDEELQKGLAGIWFRGNYENSGKKDGKMVGGYYIYMKPSENRWYLGRTPPNDPAFWSMEIPTFTASRIRRKNWYKLEIEVKGPHIQAWASVGDADTREQIFDWTDPLNAWPKGTVGLAVYNTTARWDYIHVSSLD